MLIPNNLPRPRMPRGTPVFRRINLLQPVELPNRLQPRVNQLPSARPVFRNLTMCLRRSPARSVQHPFRAPCHRANPAEIREYALSATQAFFGPNGLFFEGAHELGVEGGIEGFAGEALGECLYPDATTKRDDGFISLDGFGEVLNEFVFALALDGDLLDLDGLAVEFTRHAYRVPGDAHFALAAREAYGDACAAANKEDFLVAGDDVYEFGDGFGGGYDHGG